MLALQNTRTGELLAEKIEVAVTRAERKNGLLGRAGLAPSAGLVRAPCCAVHTAFMRFPVDVVFLDHDDRVVQIVEDLAPWRNAMCPFAHTAIELAGGSLRWRDVVMGDRLCLTGVPAPVAECTEEMKENPLTHPIIVWSDRYSA